ncbi:hypothetical protein JVT61DRAFT_11142 [Boletus reticuloceps]|uniref:Uncharacterized protein n=1 Tax=Boletus reticuloceps TaxID=495285 RepID=A0A8I3A3R1_9AGAM|nr:hypothetical protein JVT61DRAFT_11142 [Boletus reticuloceps]
MTELLFSNVRKLRFRYPDDKHLLLATLPSLVSLDIRLNNPRSFEDSLKLFAKISPSLASLYIYTARPDFTFRLTPHLLRLGPIDITF